MLKSCEENVFNVDVIGIKYNALWKTGFGLAWLAVAFPGFSHVLCLLFEHGAKHSSAGFRIGGPFGQNFMFNDDVLPCKNMLKSFEQKIINFQFDRITVSRNCAWRR